MTHPNPEFPIIVLAAGGSTRMRGRDKLLEQVDGQPLIRRQARLARSATRGPVIVALPPAPHARYDALEGLDVTTLPVPGADEGMNVSLRTAFGALPDDTKAAMLILADLPDLVSEDLNLVLQAVDLESDTLIWRGATQTGAAGHPIVFAAALFPEFARLSGDSGGREVVQAAKGHVRLIPLPGDRARRDLDTPEDWAVWRAGRRDHNN
jgi:CTP:molybdopterin cytidylyltransferase MocA